MKNSFSHQNKIGQNKIGQLLACLAGLLVSSYAWAAFGDEGTLGDIASNLLVPTDGLRYLFNISFYIMGIALLVASFLQYLRHRRNRSEVRLSTPMLLLVLGLGMLALPYITAMSWSVEAFRDTF